MSRNNYPRYFSLVMGTGTIPVKARAVAQGTNTPVKFGLLALRADGNRA